MQAIDIREFRVDFVGCSFSQWVRLRESFSDARHAGNQPPRGFRGFRATDPDARDRIFANCESDFRIARFLNGSDYANFF